MDGRILALFHTRDGKMVACEGRCPHRGGPLADGMIVNQQIVCPLHGAAFSLTDGKCDRADVRPIRMFPIRVQNDWVILGLTAKE
jgi:nitrite reductase (NADH) small subunit